MNHPTPFAHPKLPVTLQYPNPTPQGYPVVVQEKVNDLGHRVHFISNGSDEIYFEVGQYANLTIAQAIDLFKREVAERIERLEIGELEAQLLAGLSAHQFTIRWPGKARTIAFLEWTDLVYRIIYDPNSLINKQILDTLQFRSKA